MKTKLFPQTLSIAFLAAAACPAIGYSQDLQLTDMTEDSSTYERVLLQTNSTGAVLRQTNHLTVLDYGMHYFQNGQWQVSRDLVESYPLGAVATNGIYATIFSPDLNSDTAFDIRTPEGYRIRGGVRAVQLSDVKTGQTIRLGSLKESVPGEIVPPNMVLYRSAFDGIDADVLYVWAHNSFSQNVIVNGKLKQLPPGWDPAATRLEVLTELVEAPPIEILKQGQLEQAGTVVTDHGLLGFGRMVAIPGMAFPMAGGTNWDLTGPGGAHGDAAVPVAKQVRQSPDGRRFIVESVEWKELAANAKRFAGGPTAEPLDKAASQPSGRTTWPPTPPPLNESRPLLAANQPVNLQGYVVDLELLSGTTATKTFNNGTTYYIPSTFWVSSSCTFVDGTVIKLSPSGSLTLSGTVTCPNTGIATITVRDDDSVGERVTNAGSPPYTSDGVVSYSSDYAGNAINAYYASAGTIFQRLLIRYADHLIHDHLPGNTDTVRFCRLENANYGAYAYYTTINFHTNEVCYTYNSAGSGLGGTINESGTTSDCGPVFRTWTFLGVQSGDTVDGQTAGNPPDNMGAIGPDYYVELINTEMAIFNRTTGERVAQMGTDRFFRLTNSGVVYPRVNAPINDPRIIYDHRSGRWIASAMEAPSDSINKNNQVFLAVSRSSDPVGDPNTDWRNLRWDRYLIEMSEQDDQGLDFPTLGTDDNGIYISVDLPNGVSKIAAIPKASLLTTPPSMSPPTFIRGISQQTVQPAVNLDFVSANGPAWFISHRPAPTNADLRDLRYATLTWSGGTATLSNWSTIATPLFGAPDSRIFSKDTSAYSLIQGYWMRFSAVTIRSSQLWTCRIIGVNNSGGETFADRFGCEWYRLTLAGATAILSDRGRVHDTVGSNPTSYLYPSIMVNNQGAAVMAFSGAGRNAYYGAYAVARVFTDAPGVMSPIKVLKSGDAPFSLVRWGDYTQTCLDPRNSLSIWTVQQFARSAPPPTEPDKSWGTWIGEVVPIRH